MTRPARDDDFVFPKIPAKLRPLFLEAIHAVQNELRVPGERADLAEATIINRIRHAFEAAPAATPSSPYSGPEQNDIWFTCSICLYDNVDWSLLDEDETAGRHLLTVINGQMTCEYHASVVGSGAHAFALLTAKNHGMRS